MSSSSRYHHPINSRSVLVIIIVFDNSKSEIFSSGSLDRDTSFDKPFFNAFLSDDNDRGDCVMNYTYIPFVTA